MLSECEHNSEITQILQRKQRQRDFQAEIFNWFFTAEQILS